MIICFCNITQWSTHSNAKIDSFDFSRILFTFSFLGSTRQWRTRLWGAKEALKMSGNGRSMYTTKSSIHPSGSQAWRNLARDKEKKTTRTILLHTVLFSDLPQTLYVALKQTTCLQSCQKRGSFSIVCLKIIIHNIYWRFWSAWSSASNSSSEGKGLSSDKTCWRMASAFSL